MTNHTEFVIKKASSSDQYTLFKIASQFDKISKIANDDGTMQLRNKNEEDILNEHSEISTVMKGDQEKAVQNSIDLQRAKKNYKEEEAQKKINKQDEWFLESDKKSFHGFVETDNSNATSKYVLMLLSNNQEFIVMDVSDKWYKFEPMARNKELVSALEFKKKLKEQERKIEQKLNKFEFVKEAHLRQKKEDQAEAEREASIKKEDTENLDFENEWSDDEGMVAPDADVEEKLESERETMAIFFDDDEMREDQLDENIDNDIDVKDEILELDEGKRKRDEDEEEDFDTERPTKRVKTESLEDELRDYLMKKDGHAKIREILNYFVQRFPGRENLKEDLKSTVSKLCYKVKGQEEYFLKGYQK